ncbi:MAG: hypothetical protein KDA32_09050 [Phycisphaerales bacterium]|nr:hypothetical protein [Phycisphaerales bacterium]
MMKRFLTSLTVGAFAGICLAAPTIDGLNIGAPDWTNSISLQDTNTRFGNGQNELNQMYVESDSDNIYIGIPGNLADNNAMTIFFDVSSGGVASASTLATNDPNIPCRAGGLPTLLRVMDTTQLDGTFDYSLLVSVGKFPGQSDIQLVLASDITNLNTGENTPLGIGLLGNDSGTGVSGTLTTTDVTGARIAINNANAAGVVDWCFDPDDPNDPNDFFCDTRIADPNEAASATIGIEIVVPRDLIGLDTPSATTVGIFAWLTNNAQDGDAGTPCDRRGYSSNQSLPGMMGADNLGPFRGSAEPKDFTSVPGLQYVTTLIPGI